MDGSHVHRLLVVGLDGATLDLILPWAESGQLPHFRRWLAEGCYGRSLSVPNTDTAPAWATFATGLSPGNHGLFGELTWTADRRALRTASRTDWRGAAFWEVASQAGRRVLVFNVPFTFPVQPINGVIVAGVGAPAESAAGFWYPPQLRHRLPEYRLDSAIQLAIKEDRPAEGVADARRAAQQRTEALCQTMADAPWDLAVIVYSMPDVMQHFFWQQMVRDQGPQRHAIRDGYALMGQEIARLLDRAGPQTNLLIVSDHGFGPICATQAFLADWLTRCGFTRRLAPARRAGRQRIADAVARRARQVLGEAHKERLRRWLWRWRHRLESAARLGGIDWAHTQAFAPTTPWDIWLNRAGREPGGIVSAGEVEAVSQAVTDGLLAWQDAAGLPRVQAVHRASEAYRGAYEALAPDLTVEWNPAAAPPAASLPGNSSRFDADHRREGVFLAVGPDIRARGQLAGVQLQDVAPTALNLLDLALPVPVDGRVLPVHAVGQ